MNQKLKRHLISASLTAFAAGLTATIPLVDMIDFEAMLAKLGVEGVAGLAIVITAAFRAVLKELLEYITTYLEQRAIRNNANPQKVPRANKRA